MLNLWTPVWYVLFLNHFDEMVNCHRTGFHWLTHLQRKSVLFVFQRLGIKHVTVNKILQIIVSFFFMSICSRWFTCMAKVFHIYIGRYGCYHIHKLVTNLVVVFKSLSKLDAIINLVVCHCLPIRLMQELLLAFNQTNKRCWLGTLFWENLLQSLKHWSW